MFWSLFIFCEHSPREPASVVCNDEQGDLFYPAATHRNLCQPQPTQKKKSGEILEKNADEWTGRLEISKQGTPGSRRSMHGHIYGPAPGLKRKTFEL